MTANVKGIIIEVEDELFERYMNTIYPGMDFENPTDKDKDFVQLMFENLVTAYYSAFSLDEVEVNEADQLVTTHLEYASKEREKTNEPVSCLEEFIAAAMAKAIDTFQPTTVTGFIYGTGDL